MKSQTQDNKTNSNALENTRCRLDLWLVAARFFRHRADALRAIEQGRVLVGGQRAKPARNILIDDEITIEKPEGVYRIRVLERAQVRPSAKIAVNFYAEDEESKNARLAAAQQRALERKAVQFPKNRPEKHARATLRQIKRNS